MALAVSELVGLLSALSREAEDETRVTVARSRLRDVSRCLGMCVLTASLCVEVRTEERAGRPVSSGDSNCSTGVGL